MKKSRFLRNFFYMCLIYSSIFFLSRKQLNALENNFKLGVKLSPSISFFNTEGKNSQFKSSFGFDGGILFDYLFTHNHAVSSGLSYFFKKYDITINDDNYKFSISYFNMPLTFRFNTNEYWIDTCFHIFSGFVVGLKITEETPSKLLNKNKAIFKGLRPMFTIGGGIEYELALSSSIFFEIGYSTDMLNVLKKDIDCKIKKITSHMILLSLGMRF